jgi:predicted phage terminase large subunit-like protein
MWPERFPEPVVKKLESALGEYATASQLQQSPAPRGGGIIKREWWQTWGADLPEGVKATFPPFDYVIASLDPAYTERQENDPSGFSIWGIFYEAFHNAAYQIVIREPRIMLMYSWAKRLSLNALVEETVKDCKRFGVNNLLVEAKASGLSVQQELRRLYSDSPFGVTMTTPKGDKVARVHSVSHFFEDKLVFAPDKTWAQEMIDEVSTFPKGSHDDRVDTMSAALKYLRESGLVVRKQEAYSALEEEVRAPGRLRPLYPV